MPKIDKKLESLARDILVKNDMLKLPVSLLEIANLNNIKVYSISLPDSISGAIRYNDKEGYFQIFIDKNEPKKRQRFTLAHELAHFFLQGNELSSNKDVHYDTLYRNSNDPSEKEVDYLAGAILMDRQMLSELYKINPSIKELSKIFDVSESALTVRLMCLGII